MAESIFDKRLVIVTGKGGVGKSSLAAALGLCAVRRGLRVLVCEINAKERIAPLLGHEPSGPDIKEVEPNLYSINIEPRTAMREYALIKLRFQTIYNAVFENRLVRQFLRMIPSLAETVMLGKVWYEVESLSEGRPKWDLVILDAPATGHGLSFLRVPQVLLETVPPGPMREDAERMNATLTDPAKTSLQIVTLPEEMPANETIELEEEVRDALGIPLGHLFLNAWVPPRFEPAEVQALEEIARRSPDCHDLGPGAAAARAALHQAGRAELSAFYERKLHVAIPDMPMLHLPRIYSGTWGRAEMERLSTVIDDALGAEA